MKKEEGIAINNTVERETKRAHSRHMKMRIICCGGCTKLFWGVINAQEPNDITQHDKLKVSKGGNTNVVLSLQKCAYISGLLMTEAWAVK